MGNFMIGNIYPPYLGRIDKIYCGGELCWPTNTSQQEVNFYAYIHNGNYYEYAGSRLMVLDKDYEFHSPYNGGEWAYTWNKISEVAFITTSMFDQGYKVEKITTTFPPDKVNNTGTSLSIPYKSFSNNTYDVGFYFRKAVDKTFILMDNEDDKNVLATQTIHAYEVYFDNIREFLYYESIPWIKHETGGNFYAMNYKGDYELVDIDPIRIINGEFYFENADDIIIYMNPYPDRKQTVRVQVYTDRNEIGEYTLEDTKTYVLDSNKVPGTPYVTNDYIRILNKNGCGVVEINDQVEFGRLLNIETGSPNKVEVIPEQKAFYIDYNNFDDTSIYELKFYLGRYIGFCTIELWDSYGSAGKVYSVDVDPNVIWEEAVNGGVRGREFLYRGTPICIFNYITDPEYAKDTRVLDIEVKRYVNGYWDSYAQIVIAKYDESAYFKGRTRVRSEMIV